MKTTSAQRMAALRNRMRALGFVVRDIWIHPDDWARVKAYIRKLNKGRGS